MARLPCTVLKILLLSGSSESSAGTADSPFSGGSSLEEYFDSPLQAYGPVAVKWKHYFDIYERHFARFRGTDVIIVEVGNYAGGGLKMWRWYFGKHAKIYGVDIDHRTRHYQGKEWYGNAERIFTGAQDDRELWARVKRALPRVDILIDDASHMPDNQIVTLQEMMPHLSAGGVFLCEDVYAFKNGSNPCAMGLKGVFPCDGTQRSNPFVQHVFDNYIRAGLNVFEGYDRTSEVQGRIAEVSFYPYVIAIQKLPDKQVRRSLVVQWSGTERVVGGCWSPHRERISRRECCVHGNSSVPCFSGERTYVQCCNDNAAMEAMR